MTSIRQLDAHTANLIAAGEVVERPASVAKELMENAVDAGATQITVEIQNGGMRLLRVSDNGSGIPASEAETAFLRHATSKISTARDLEAIHTLGFRGEALAAIAAVARVDLLTRTADQPYGIAIALEGGVLRDRAESGCPQGTTLVVRDLFFNTPARLKFMKRDASEGAAVFAVVQRAALSHPEVAVKFIRDGKQELLTPGDGDLRATLYAVFGRDLALGLQPLRAEGEDVLVEGFVSLPSCCRGTRGYQHFMLNGRPIRSPLLTAALEEAYRNSRMVGKFPACVLQLTLRPNLVDVNVHPAKTEVKFLFERKIFDAVQYAVRAALDGVQSHPTLEVDGPPPAAPPAPQVSPPSPDTSDLTFRDGAAAMQQKTPLVHRASAAPEEMYSTKFPRTPAPPLQQTGPGAAPPPMGRTPWDDVQPAPVSPPKAPVPAPSSAPKAPTDIPAAPARPTIAREQPPGPPPAALQQARLQEPASDTAAAWRMVGEAFDTYIIVEQDGALHLIDKHAAHERMHFDRMQRKEQPVMAQTLLVPLSLHFPPEEYAALLQHAVLLEDFGFALEAFGGDVLLLRQLPETLSPDEVEQTLAELARQLLGGARIDPATLRDNLLHSIACKAAVKGGQKNAPAELNVIAEAVMAGAVKTCPHGRPVAITLSRGQLEHRFGRA